MQLIKNKTALLVVLALQQLAVTAQAQTASSAPAKADSSEKTVLPEVVVTGAADYAPTTSTVGGKTPTLLRDIPQSVTVVNREVMNAQAATTMTEALRNVPGITISAGEGGAIGDNINLRGFSARTDVFLDGLRDRGQYTRDTFAIEAVEVLKGPSSMLFGRGSTGGVINQVSKKPSKNASSEIKASIGTDNYYRTTLDVNRPIGDDAAFRVAAFVQDSKSTRDVVEKKDFGLAPSLRLGIGSATEVTLSALIQRNNDIPDFGFPLVTTNGAGTVRKPIAAPSNRYLGYTDDHFDQNVDVVSATIRHKLTPNITLRNQTQIGRYEIDASPSPLGAVTRTGGGVPSFNDPLTLLQAPRQDRDRTINDRSIFNQTDFITTVKTDGITHNLTVGFEIGKDNYEESRYIWNTTAAQASINLGSPVNGTRQGSRVLSRIVKTSADSYAVYVNDQIDLNKEWKVVAGLRWDSFKVDTNLQKSVLPAGFTADTTKAVEPKTDRMFNPRAGLLYQPTETQTYYVSYGTSFNPSAETVTQSSSTAKLDPEKNRSLEVGTKLDFLEGDLSFNSALFQVQKANARSTDPLTGAVNLDGDVRVRGLELGIVGRITPQWQVLAGYTFLDGKVLRSKDRSGSGTVASPYVFAEGKTLQNTPRHSASAWTTYSFLGDWEAGGGVVYSAKRNLNNYEDAVTDGYTRLDATVAYKQAAYDIRVNLQNLTDKVYFETASGGRATPVKGRGLIVTGAYRF
jgi:catecholate siderophore receptor